MSRTLFVLCACALVFAAAMGQEEAPAAEEPFQGNENGYSLLIARRTFMSDSFVEGVPMTVKIQIWNIGTKFAHSTRTHSNPEKKHSKVNPGTKHLLKQPFTHVRVKQGGHERCHR